ncbi:hypothetical protein SLA2020_513920 [Shorea laevis]
MASSCSSLDMSANSHLQNCFSFSFTDLLATADDVPLITNDGGNKHTLVGCRCRIALLRGPDPVCQGSS